MSELDRVARAGLMLLPGALVVFLSFSGGGFFVRDTALAAVLVAIILVVRVLVADRPFAGIGPAAAVAVSLLAVYAIWTLASAQWSDAPARALVEFDRALLYLLVLLLYCSLPHSVRNLRLMLGGLAVAVVAVCAIALTTRVAPDVWPISPNVANDRLSYPITYWNALGLLTSLGILMCTYFASSANERPWARVLGAAGVPILATTLLLTFSRGAIVAAIVGLVVYAAVARPRLLPTAVLAIAPPTAVALVVAYGADELASSDPTTSAAVAQGHDLALVVALCAGAAALARGLLLPLDGRVERLRLSPRVRRPAIVAAVAVPLLLVAIAVPALGAPGYVERQYDRFLDGSSIDRGDDNRARLTNPANNGRLEHWEVALDSLAAHPVNGAGAGTYQVLWTQGRPTSFDVLDAHSLYVEVLGELGWVGLLVLAGAIIALLVPVLLRAQRHPAIRPLYGLVFAVGLTWALHAGIDWDWEMPALTIIPFALGGAAIAASPRRWRLDIRPGPTTRLVMALALLALAVTPGLLLVSQQRLTDGLDALKRGDCRASIDASLGSISVLAVRPEPWELLGYCDAKLGAHALAEQAFEQAVDRDPENWELHYGLALVRGAGGRDPRRAAREALRLNPRDPRTQAAAEALATPRRRDWRRWAAKAELPLP